MNWIRIMFFFGGGGSVESRSSVHFRRSNLETLNTPDFFVSPDYRGFPVLLDENKHRIWIQQIKIHELAI